MAEADSPQTVPVGTGRREAKILRQLVDEQSSKPGVLAATFESPEAAAVTLDFGKGQLSGKFGLVVRNVGRVPLVAANLKWRTDFGGRTLHDSQHRVGLMRSGGSSRMEAPFAMRASLSDLSALSKTLMEGFVTVQQHVVLQAIGYKRDWRAEVVAPIRVFSLGWA